ncbi:MAG: class I SAM-dependent methyltransferase [Pseudomonadota bacterium]
MSNVLEHNRKAWDAESTSGNSAWSVPVDAVTVDNARRGQWQIFVTPLKPVPHDWFGGIEGKRVLGLASGGGQQNPVLAAAGAKVTSFDLSAEQLAKDGFVAERDALEITLEQGDMADLSRFADASFDLIVHPVANVFAPDVGAVWRECHRVLAPGGRLITAFMNPDFFLFDHDALDSGGALEVRYSLPFASARDLPPQLYEQRVDRQEAFEFSHSLEDQIGGQLAAGFTIHGFYEDRWTDAATPLNPHMPTTFATLAIRSSA